MAEFIQLMQEFIAFLLKYQVLILSGAKMTLVISLVAGVLSVLVGSGLCYLRMHRIAPLRWIANIWVEFVRGTPVLVQIMMVFFGLPLLGFEMPTFGFLDTSSERMLYGILALTINSSGYICEIIRSGIQSIDVGQMEAARSIGFGKASSMMLVVMPQAIKNILPNFGNEFANLIKASSQVMVIGVAELMFTYNTVSGLSYRAFMSLVPISILYFAMTFTVSLVVRALEKHYKKSER